VRKADNLSPSCAVVTKSGSLNFLRPSGPAQACNGTALPYIYLYIYLFNHSFTVFFKIKSPISLIISDAQDTRDIKSMLAMAKVLFNKKTVNWT